MSDILILGGYGNFGKRIAHMLTRSNIAVTIAGRDRTKAEKLVQTLPAGLADAAVFDIRKDLASQLSMRKPALVIHTCGPFQQSDYAVAETCIQHGVHYIDLADGREFVRGIRTLDDAARKQKVAVISGASTVPGLSSAVIEHFLPGLPEIHSLTFGISPGQRTERGLATTQAVLGYVGQRLQPCAGHPIRYGWQDMYRQTYPVIGRRWMANCDIPDLDLLPEKYGIPIIRFSAGMENPAVHLGIWLLSWLVRLGLPIRLADYSPALLKASRWFDILGSADGGMHVILNGRDASGTALTRTWFIIARDGDGPYIPAVPAVVLAKKILAGTYHATGATACVGLITLDEYLHELAHLNIHTYMDAHPAVSDR